MKQKFQEWIRKSSGDKDIGSNFLIFIPLFGNAGRKFMSAISVRPTVRIKLNRSNLAIKHVKLQKMSWNM